MIETTNMTDIVIKQVIVQACNGSVLDFYAYLNSEYQPDMYSRDDARVKLRKMIQEKNECAKYVHLYKS